MTMVKQYRDYANMVKEDQNMVGGFRCFGCDCDYDEGFWLEVRGEDPTFYCRECAEEAGIIGQPGVYEQ